MSALSGVLILLAGVALAGPAMAAKDPPPPAKRGAAVAKPAPAKVAAPKAPVAGKPAAKPAAQERKAAPGRAPRATAKTARAGKSAGQKNSPAASRAEPAAGDAVRVGDDIMMNPNGQDATGCRRYSMSSRGFGPLQAVFYRTAKGDFTTDRNEAACHG